MNLLRFDSEQAWIEGIATFWGDRLRCAPRLRHCLTSGHTPLKPYAAMVKAVAAGLVSFRQAEIFALDEYGGLAGDDPGRCSNMLRQHLVDPVDLPKERFYFLNPEAGDVEWICRSYEEAIGVGFDLAILGVGTNGHLGLNEPGSAPDSPTRRVEMAASSISASAKYVQQTALPRWGVTVGLQRLLAAKEVWLLANGHGKAEIIRRILTGEVGPEVPASFLRRHANAYLFIDQEAAALL